MLAVSLRACPGPLLRCGRQIGDPVRARLGCLVAMVALAALALVAAPAAGAHLTERHICDAHRCTTIAASRNIRVFEATRDCVRGRCKREEPEYRVEFAAWLPTGKVTELAPKTEERGLEAYVSEAKIAGPYAAFRISGLVQGKYDEPELPEKVERIDVETGRRTFTPTVNVSYGGGPRRLYFAVTSDGTVAWAFAETFYTHESTVDVLVANSKITSTLAHGPNVEPASLALIPGHAYWLEAGIPRTFLTR
jgi:hypothetical protein